MGRVLGASQHPGGEAGSYLRLADSCITQLKAQGPSRTCNESKEEEEALSNGSEAGSYLKLIDFVYHSTLGLRVIKKKSNSGLRVQGTGLEALLRMDPRRSPPRGVVGANPLSNASLVGTKAPDI